MTLSVLALDLGTRTGWAAKEKDRAIVSGAMNFKLKRFEGSGMRFLRFKRWLTELKANLDGIEALYFEAVRRGRIPIQSPSKALNILKELVALWETLRIPPF